MQIITYSKRRFVKRHRGTMPVILTCPHDGSEQPANVKERTRDATPSGCHRFSIGRDPGTALITEGVAQRILDISGLSPYVVIAQFHRKFIDANRERGACAYTDPDGEEFYDEYHGRIAGYVRQILAQNSNAGFLFDIHGTPVLANDPADVYIGTANGGALLPGFDRRSIFMQHGLHGLLKWVRRSPTAGSGGRNFRYAVSPADENAEETGRVNGGFTIRHYGESTISSIQIEAAATIRDDTTRRNFFIEDLAFAIIILHVVTRAFRAAHGSRIDQGGLTLV